ncbi:MAG TPA: SUMF1/EgtB/PvdO family nonheme iron enzyme [Roseiflexaceae bacterium]|nr:SUMF1/EgtB/PvdO family nonheme iron enzyme [Roseiflexaceae bacterium]
MFEQSAGSGDAQAHSTIRGSLLTARLAELLALLPGFAPEKSGEARSQHAASEAVRWRQNIGQRGGVLQELGNLPGGNDVAIQFAHLTFQEYLAARAAASEDTERRLGRILHCWDRPAWREVLLLYASSHDATPVVRHLLHQGDAGALLAGAVLLERPFKLDEGLQEQTITRIRALAFESAEASKEQALEALAQLEERAALPERAALLHAFQHAPHGPVRARALELALERELLAPPQPRRPPVRVPTSGSPPQLLSPAAKPPAPPLPPELVPALLRTWQHDPHHRPRLAAGYALAGADPRFGGEGWVPELVHVPAGPFLMGSADTDTMAPDGEKPQHRLELPDFWIGKYPVTVGQWRRFADSDGYTNCAYWTKAGWRFIHTVASLRPLAQPWYARLLPERRTAQTSQPFQWRDPGEEADNLPVFNISWFEAVAYYRWLSAQTGHPFRLPSEAEWEKAARGPDGRIWPWGDTWRPDQCNSAELGLGRRSPVGSFPSGASPYGALDMAGNVWEWCATQYQRYPYEQADEWAAAYLEADVLRRCRGGSFVDNQQLVRGAVRFISDPRERDNDRGLRVASHSPRSDAES